MLKNTTSKRILVTGGAGFVGSNLCERLLREGHRVICLDNLYTGSLGNIKEFLEHKNFEFHQMDILEKTEVEKLMSLDIDEIYHLACPASPVHYQRDAIYTTRTCVREPSTCWNWHVISTVQFSSPRRVRSMATRWSIPRRRIIMAT